MDIILTQDVYSWTAMVNSTDYPLMEISMCGFVETLLTLILPEETVDDIVANLLDTFGNRLEIHKIRGIISHMYYVISYETSLANIVTSPGPWLSCKDVRTRCMKIMTT